MTMTFQVDEQDKDNYLSMVRLWFTFCVIWSLCCTVDEDSRVKIDAFFRELDGTFPNKDSVFEYYVDVKNKQWQHWEEKLHSTVWKYNPV